VLSAPAGTTLLRGPVAAGVAGKLAEAVTLVLLATLVPRLLGPDAYGRFSVALTVVAIGSVALTLGGVTLLARYVPAAAPADRVPTAWALTRRLARNRVLPFAGLVLLGVVLVLADPARLAPLPAAFVLLALGLNVVTTMVLQAELGLGRAGPWCARYPLQNAVLVAAVLALPGPTGTVLAIVLAAATGSALAAVAVAPRLRAGRPRAVALPVGALRFGGLQAGSGVLTQLAQRGGVIAVALLAGSAAQTGFAALAVGIALAATYAVAQLFTVALPVLVGRGAGTGPATDPAEAALRRLAGLLQLVLILAVILAVPVLDAGVPAVFGAGYAGAVAAFGPALAMVVLAPLNALAVQAAALRLRPDATLRSALVGAAAFLAVAMAAVPSWGAVGATAAALAGAAAAAAASVRLLPGAVGAPLAAASFGGAALVVLLGVAG
jgi:O-antigen/teichoic acid export membrane protein